jgi:acyl carrier protein
MSDRQNTMDRILRCLEWAEIDIEDVKEGTILTDDIGMNSLDRIRLATEIEDEFDIEVEYKTIMSWETVGDIVRYVNKNIRD